MINRKDKQEMINRKWKTGNDETGNDETVNDKPELISQNW